MFSIQKTILEKITEFFFILSLLKTLGNKNTSNKLKGGG